MNLEAGGLSIQDGVLVGPIRHSINRAINAKGSIHDDETAQKLGMRGGTVAGSVHMDLFGPLFLAAFGEDWWERGTLSLYFINATVDREPVRAFLRMPVGEAKDCQVDVWIEREDGMRVAEGTASVGSPAEPTALLRRPVDRFDAGELRIIKHIRPGDAIAPVDAVFTSAALEEHLKYTTEPLEIYRDSKWGGAVVPISSYVSLLYGQAATPLRSTVKDVVGLFGAIEIRNINGPMLVDQHYTTGGKVIAVGQSPKTEYYWYETWADDASGKRIAEHRMLTRFMKASSPEYREAPAG